MNKSYSPTPITATVPWVLLVLTVKKDFGAHCKFFLFVFLTVFRFWSTLQSLWHWCCDPYTTIYYIVGTSYLIFSHFFSCCLNYFSIRDQDLCNLFNPHQWICTTKTTTSLPSLNSNSSRSSSKHVQPLRIPLVHCYEKCKQTAEYLFTYFQWKKNRCICPSFPLFLLHSAHTHTHPILVPFPYHFFISPPANIFFPCFPCS